MWPIMWLWGCGVWGVGVWGVGVWGCGFRVRVWVMARVWRHLFGGSCHDSCGVADVTAMDGWMADCCRSYSLIVLDLCCTGNDAPPLLLLH
jgi:hypothetical protein